jgi:hypothetical protein
MVPVSGQALVAPKTRGSVGYNFVHFTDKIKPRRAGWC